MSEEDQSQYPTMTATYSPEDNKLRLYSMARLSTEIYQLVRSSGFIWAPKQELFVAPMWTPDREDLLFGLCGEIGDEDKSLVERSEERAERMENYAERRKQDAERAHAAVASIADNIPLGQPILVGHHSERHARKDAERIENGMRSAIKMWEQSKYWEQRAKGAIHHAKYKERPEVRARRIKTIEADKRRRERTKKSAEKCLEFWTGNAQTNECVKIKVSHKNAVMFCNYYDHLSFSFPLEKYPRSTPASQYEGPMSLWSALGGSDGETHSIITVEQATTMAIEVHQRMIASCQRWIGHFDNRLLYEKAMLQEQGAEDLLLPPRREKQLPLCNYRAKEIKCPDIYTRGESVTFPQVEMTSAEYAKIHNDYKGTRICENSHRVRIAMRHRVTGGSIARSDGPRLVCVFLKDSKVHQKPEPVSPTPKVTKPAEPARNYAPPERTKFDDLKDTLEAGIKIVSAPQLFPTPPDMAKQMVNAAGLMAGRRILEPSAGTGNIIRAAINDATGFDCCRIVAVEINPVLVNELREMRQSFLYANEKNFDIHCANFLECNDDLGKFDVILMNPPFERGSDIKHIKHAITFLKPGGRLVAICANGPRQQEELQPLADEWLDLPAGSFKESGTNVNAAMMVVLS